MISSECRRRNSALTSSSGVVSDPEQVWLHGHSAPLGPRRVLAVLTEARLKVTVGDGGVKGRLWETNGMDMVSGSAGLKKHCHEDL